MSRPFARLARPTSQPGQCVRCPRNSDVFDLGADELRGYGVVYLCSVCMGELLEAMQTVSADVFQRAVAEAAAANNLLRDELAVARAAAGAPTAEITQHLKEFSDGIDRLARTLSQRIADTAARGDSAPVPAAEPATPVLAAVPLEDAGEPDAADDDESATDAERVSESAKRVDLDALFGSIGVATAVAPAPADGASGALAAPHIDNLRIDPFELIRRGELSGTGTGDDEPAGN